MSETCPYCQGQGKIPSAESISIEIERDLRRLSRAQNAAEAFCVTCHPQVAAYLIGESGENIEVLEHLMQRGVYVRADESLHQEKYEIQPGRMDELDRKHLAVRRGQVVDARVVRNALDSPPSATALTESGYLIELPQGAKYIGQGVRVRLLKVGRSIAEAEVLNKGGGSSGGDSPSPVPAPRLPEPIAEPRDNRERGGSGGGGRGANNQGGRRGNRRGQPRETQPA
jgi:ribonuclease G